MHDVPETALARPTLPSDTSMPKVADAFTVQSLGKEDPGLDSEGLSTESESYLELEDSADMDVHIADITHVDVAEKVIVPPVTPDSPMPTAHRNGVQANSLAPIPDEKKIDEEADTNKGTLQSSAAEATTNMKEMEADAQKTFVAPEEEAAKRDSDAKSGNTKSRRPRGRRYEDDASSSDDDSYFKKHLPDPRSGRRFSYDYSSEGSAGAAASPYYHSNADRESDASLSLSEDSDDEMHSHDVHVSPMIQPRDASITDMNLYPQRITRMHSVSSLVSSASSDDGHKLQHHDAPRSSTSSVSSYGTSGTTSDPSVGAELQEVGFQGRPSSQLTEASGRRSPVMGQHGIPGYFYSTPSPVMSPPPIMQGYAPQPGLSHPQPQPMSQEQMAAWNFNNTEAGQYHLGQGYAPPAQVGLGPHPGGFHNIEERSALFNEYNDGFGQGGGKLPSQGDRPQSGNTGSQKPGPNGAKISPDHESNDAKAGVLTGMGDTTDAPSKIPGSRDDRGYKVYWQRWLMLLYMSILNLLSDWTCYSVAPISLLTEKAFGDIDPERLVVVFLGANAVASISEPVILSRLGLRRTVLFGALLLMIGSIIKSGGVPPILKSDIREGESEWRLYLGFFLVGLSQPLYQCTPTLLSSSWFPEEERTMATGVALNANQLGIGFAFVFGTLLVANKDDIIPYFGLLSTISTVVFLGALIQFDDAPPTPPSASARVVRGTFDTKLPSINTIVQSVRGGFNAMDGNPGVGAQQFSSAAAPSPAGSQDPVSQDTIASRKKGKSDAARRRGKGSRSSASAPSSAQHGSTDEAIAELARIKAEAATINAMPPSHMASGTTEGKSDDHDDAAAPPEHSSFPQDNPYAQFPGMMPPGAPPGMAPPPPGNFPPPYPPGYWYWDPRMQRQQQPPMPQQGQFPPYYQYQQPSYPPPPHPYYFPHGTPPPYLAGYDFSHAAFPGGDDIDEGAEPILTITPHHLDIDIRDDQVIRSLKACFARRGFIHALVAFTASGIVINTLSTYMDYLVRLNGAPRAYTGIVGGAFQFSIMISSLIIGRFTDKSRAYYSVTIGMLVLGAFGLAECGVSLDSDRGNDLRWCLIVVAVLVGPLQPVSTELGVDVVYPLSENTVLVVQQLFSNLLSALFIPVFKALKDVGSEKIDDTEMYERPQYTFSFYLLIVIHTTATVFFATFNGKYLRYEHELERKAEEEEQDERERIAEQGVHPFFRGGSAGAGEQQPLLNPV